ncbi:DUF3467 domain-containing protein [Desulfoluna sp.]|uniref:DUF3467 domain-containing protein n=1 Tax=Desulfoluna sp. TaxID=2045199 RepID=UPI0026226CBA|nr:DUF3467 domain-containing protein [Desulfoluna sp.]
MTKQKETAVEHDAEVTEEKSAGTKVLWDTSKLSSAYANVCNVSSTREEMTLLFGTNKSWNPAEKELTVELTNRMIMNPYAAKRFSVLLDKIVKEYEERFGELKLDAQAE